MASVLRSSVLSARVIRPSTCMIRSHRPVRFAHSSYGDSQSGHQKSDAANPKVDEEHPGPEAPADKGTAQSSSTSEQPSSSEKSASDESTKKKTKSGAQPAIHNPNDGPDTNDPEVKKHNEDMRNRAEQTPNQIK